ncbi:hypothetical protein OH76DRAFT_1413129 [Lentinus brumalis]|uniref:Uncharacterized protein n=1 Tax=Lentinus brumalis TaxID=2498619 RepID=A0A371CIV4_9APHY|nr:hypothetical protein OH76DRAFT_1413129 [Polyporus brumalis]
MTTTLQCSERWMAYQTEGIHDTAVWASRRHISFSACACTASANFPCGLVTLPSLSSWAPTIVSPIRLSQEIWSLPVYVTTQFETGHVLDTPAFNIVQSCACSCILQHSGSKPTKSKLEPLPMSGISSDNSFEGALGKISNSEATTAHLGQEARAYLTVLDDPAYSEYNTPVWARRHSNGSIDGFAV